MDKIKILFTLFLICMIINATGQITDESGWKIYYDKEFYFSINYPSDWELHNDTAVGKCFIYAPEDSTATYQANVAVDAFRLPVTNENLSVKEYAEISFGQFRKALQHCEVMITKDISLNNVPRFLVVANGMVNKKHLYFKQLYCIYNNIAYIINYTGEAGKKDPFAIIAGDILSSFQPQVSNSAKL